MAIQFARIEYGSRSQGSNACRKAAYNAREAIKCERTGQLFYFKHKTDNVFHKILLPEGVDPKFKDSATLWNAAEKAERRKDSQVYKECVIALHDDKIVSDEDRMEIAQRFAEFVFVSKGLGCQIDIHAPHEGEKNWHAHFTVTTRRFREDGLALSAYKARDTDPEVRKGKVVEADAVGEIYADIQNAFFKEKGYDLRVDPVAIVSQIHLGPVRMRTHMNSALERAEMLRAANEVAVRTPECILKKLTEKQSTFTEEELAKFLAKQVVSKFIDLKEVPTIKEATLRHENTVALYDPDTLEKTHRYTTTHVRSEEEKLLRFADVVNARGRAVVKEKFIQRVIFERKLSEEQVKALRFVTTSENGLSIIEGRAGVGKSHVLQAIRDAYQDQGYRVVGLAPTGAVATDMAKDEFKEAYTVHKMLFMYKNDRFSLNQNTVLIVDEAAMLGTSAYVELFNVAKSHKCKVILVGDDRQISSVDRGGAFSFLTQKMGSRELTQVRRQTIPWQKEVSRTLGQGEVVKAIELLSQNNALSWSATKAESMATLIQAWEKDHAQDSTKTKLILATRNVEVDAINTAIREIRLRRGEIEAKGYECHTQRGREVFSVGDRVCLAQTDKTLGIVNGSFGHIKSLSENQCQINLDEGKEVEFNPQTYHGLKLGYAATVYKSQGKTLDQVYVLHSNATNSLINYVALSRQVQSLQVFVNQGETRNRGYLIEQMSRNNGKTLSLKYLTEEQVNQAKTLGDGYWDAAKEVWIDLKTNVQNKLSDFFHENKEFYDIKGREQDKGRQQVLPVDSSSLKSQDSEGKQWTWVKEPQLSTQEEQQEKKQGVSLIQHPTQSEISKSPANNKPTCMSSEDVKETLKQRTAELARDLLGEPTRKGKREWRYGTKGSIAIFVEGPKKGLYANFETGVHGNGLQLIQDHLGLNREDSYKWALEWLGERLYSRPQELAKPKIEEHTVWKPMFPVPDKAPKPDIETNPYLSYMAKDRQITAMYEYKDCNGNLLGYVVRLEDREGGKITPTLTYCKNEKRQQHWRWQGFGEDRPLYGQEKLVKHPTQAVLIVEGEKTADSAQKLFPNHVVISWPGGAGAVEKANWGPLLGRNVTIWPDQTPVGLKAAQLIEAKLKDINESYKFKVAITTVDLPKDLPSKWDLADALPKNLSLKDLQNLVHKEQGHQKTSLPNVEQVKGDQRANRSQEHTQPEIKTTNLPSPLPHKQDRADELPESPSIKKAKTPRSQEKVTQNSVEKPQDLSTNLSKETFNDIVDRFKLISVFSKPNENHFKVATEVFKALESCALPNQNMEHLKERSVFMALRIDEMGSLYVLEKPEALSRLLIESRLWQNLARIGERVDMNLILHRSVGNLKEIEDTHKQKKHLTQVHKFNVCAFGIQKNTASLEKGESSLQALIKIVNEQRDIHRQLNLERERINELSLER